MNYYKTFGGKHTTKDNANNDYSEPLTPQQNKDNHFLKKVTNFYLKNRELEEDAIKLKSIGYLDKKGILKDKVNKRYYKDNDLAEHLKVNKKQ